jgi:hypothetical protein
MSQSVPKHPVSPEKNESDVGFGFFSSNLTMETCTLCKKNIFLGEL